MLFAESAEFGKTPTLIRLLFIVSVVAQTFRVEVEVTGAARGCTAVLKCIIPPFVKDLVRIISWIQEPTFFIYPSLQGGMYNFFLF